jgi:hypothetical protein
LEEAPVRSASVTNRADSGAGRRVSRRPAEEDEDLPPPSRRGYDDEREDEDHARRAPKGDPVKGWQRVRLGLNLVLTGLFLFIGAFIVWLVGGGLLFAFIGASIANMAGSLAGGPSGSQAAGQAAGTGVAAVVGFFLVVGLGALLWVSEMGFRLAGEGFCMGVVPPRRATYLKGLAITVFALGAANLLFFYGGFCGDIGLAMLSSSNKSGGYIGGLGIVASNLASLIFLGERYCFLFFLRGTAIAMRNDGLGRQLVIYMIALPVAWVLMTLLLIVVFCGGGLAMFSAATSAAGSGKAGAGAAAGNAAGMAVGWLVAIIACYALAILVAIGLFIWYIVLLFQTRGAVSGYLHDRE